MIRKPARMLAVMWLLVAASCASGRAVVTPEYGVDGVVLNEHGFAVSSARGIGRFQVEALGRGPVVVRLRYELGRPIEALEGLEVVVGTTGVAVADERARFERGRLELRMAEGEIWRVHFVDRHR